MWFGILGPLQVSYDEVPVVVQTPKQRALLAVLLVHANQVVSTDRLVELLWNGAPPADATRALHVHVSQLRRALHPQRPRRGRDELLIRQPPGYLLSVAPGALDLHRFEQLVAQARRAGAGGDIQQTAVCLWEALELWRGPVLAGIDVVALQQTVVPRLEEARLAAVEERIEADLLLGRHAELVGELQELVAEQPLRERLWGQLLVALYRAGRQGEALATYTRARRRLVEELGIEPSAELQRLQRLILAADPAMDAPLPSGTAASVRPAIPPTGYARPVPRQLPADIASFTGRKLELARLDRVLGAAGRTAPMMILAIHGMGGIGKSALTIHAAYRLVTAFPDGQLYVDLAGATAGLAPLHPLEVLGRFLRALGVNGQDIPGEVDEAAARFRSQVAGRRLLVVLDNARDSAQVVPLLPASPGCAVLVTSRRVLASLDGAPYLHLGVLPLEEAVALLGRLAGRQRIAAEPVAAAGVARWCGFLPLAVRIAGRRLAARPDWPVGALAELLADEQRRLDELEVGILGVRTSLGISLQELSTSADPVDRAAAAVFPLLGVRDGPDFGLSFAARLMEQSEGDTKRLLERLVDAQLLEALTPGRYRLHDLLRLYARERLASSIQ